MIDTQQKKVITTFKNLSGAIYQKQSSLLLDIIQYNDDTDIIEHICENPKILDKMVTGNIQVFKHFTNQKNINLILKNKICNTLVLMKQFNPQNYSKLIRSKGFKEIETGALSIALLKNLKYNDTIDDNYFYNLFNKIEKDTEMQLSETDSFVGYNKKQIQNIIELDPARQDEIMGYIKNAKDPDLMKKIIQYCSTGLNNLNFNISRGEQNGIYENPINLNRKRALLITLIKYTSSHPEIARFAASVTYDIENIATYTEKIATTTFKSEESKQELMKILTSNKSRFDRQSFIAAIDFCAKFEDLTLLKQLIYYNMTHIIKDITENNIEYIKENIASEKPTLIDETVMRLAKDMPEFKDPKNRSNIEIDIKAVIKNEFERYLQQYRRISDQIDRDINSLKEKRQICEANGDWGKFKECGNEINYKILLKNRELDSQLKTYQWRVGLYTGLAEIKLKSPETYQRIVDSGIIEMIKADKLQPSVLSHLNANSDLSDEIYEDLEAAKQGKSIVPEFSAGTSLDEVFSKTKIGDAVEVGNKMYINDGTQLSEWAMTKEKFLELFPPVLRFTTTQGALGDCYLVSAISACLRNPYARAEIYKSFKLDGNNIVVTIKGYEDFKGSTIYPNGEIKLDTWGAHLTGCKGAQMLEQAYAKCSLREHQFDYLPVLDESLNQYSLMQRVRSGATSTAMGELLGLTNYGINHVKTLSKATVSVPYDERKSLDMIKKAIKNKTAIIHIGTKQKPNSEVESTFLKEYNLVSSHAYEIVGYDEQSDLITINNPHSASTITKIPFKELNKYINFLHITSID